MLQSQCPIKYNLVNSSSARPPETPPQNPEMTASNGEVLCLALNHGEHCEGRLYRLHRGTILRIVPGVSLLGRQISLATNYPVKGDTYARKTFNKLQWHNKNGELLPGGAFVEVTSLDIYCEIGVVVSGSFKFEFEYEGRSVDNL